MSAQLHVTAPGLCSTAMSVPVEVVRRNEPYQLWCSIGDEYKSVLGYRQYLMAFIKMSCSRGLPVVALVSSADATSAPGL